MRKDIPRKLYKYFGPDRVSFFNDLRVRFSQLGSFNDPFEGRAEISSFAKGEDILRRLGNVTREQSESVYQSLPPHIKSTRRVQYRETRPSVPLAEVEATDLFLAKSGHWDYEREWRIVRPLDEAVAMAGGT